VDLKLQGGFCSPFQKGSSAAGKTDRLLDANEAHLSCAKVGHSKGMRRLEMTRNLAGLAAVAGLLAAGAAVAQDGPTKPEKYPLRVHVLAIDDTHRTVRMQPNWCSTSVPNFGGDAGGSGGGDPCSSGSGTLSFGGDDDFSGGGRADLVSPPNATQALSFTYEGCNRMRVPAGFQGLPARWKTPGKKLEVLIPSDASTRDGARLPVQRCVLTATLHDFVYLRMRTGALLQVTQEAYWKKPSLRRFLSGGTQTLETRAAPVVSVKQLAAPVGEKQ
jgi:hypothetical protein